MIIQSVWHALIIFSLFSRQKTQVGITEVSQTLGVTKGAAHNLVTTLVRGGFLFQDPETKKYKLGLKIFEIGMLQPQIQYLNQQAIGPITELSHSHTVVTRVALWDNDAVLVTWTNYPPNRPEMSNSVGPRLRAHSTALGKCILAHLPSADLEKFLSNNKLTGFTNGTITDEASFRQEIEGIAKKGYALDREESLLGLVCMGAPVFDNNSEVLGAVSLSGSPEKIQDETRLPILARDLLRTAERISVALGYSPMSDTVRGHGRG